MAVKRPLRLVDGHRFREMTNLGGASAEMYLLHQQIAYLYAQNQTVTLSVVSSGGNISTPIQDTRKSSSATTTGSGTGDATDDGAAEFPAPTNTITVSGVTYDKVSQSVISDPGLPTYSIKPVIADGVDGVIEMSEQDVVDTFIDPVIDLMVSDTTDPRAGGSYFVSTASSQTNCTNLGTIFIDTFADISSYTNSGIESTGSVQDHNTSTTYSLFRNDGVNAAYPKPLVIDGTSGLREMTTSEFSTYFTALIKAHIFGQTGNTLRYNFDGSGTNRGTLITDQRYDSQVEGNRQVGDEYRSQNFPTGTLQPISTTQLKVERT